MINGENGKPVNVLTVYDAKGKKPAIQYDYIASNYIKNDNVWLYHDLSIIRNDNTK